MTTISAPRDDEGILRLKFFNDATALTDAPHQVQPYPGLRPATREIVRNERRRDTPRRFVRRGPDRRQGERRQHETPVLLDTRGTRDRRRRLRRREDRGANRLNEEGRPAPQAVRGIDTYA